MTKARVIKRIPKIDLKKAGYHEHENLSFLLMLPIYSLLECKFSSTNRRQYRVEILPSALKKISESYGDYLEIKKLYRSCLSDVDEKDARILELSETVEKLQRVNHQLMANIEDWVGFVDTGQTLKSQNSIFHEAGVAPHGPGMQGGAPSLGKNKS